MNVTLNGQTHDIAEQLTLDQLLESKGFGNQRVAVEINRQIIPRSRYNLQALSDGDKIEIVHAIGGG